MGCHTWFWEPYHIDLKLAKEMLAEQWLQDIVDIENSTDPSITDELRNEIICEIELDLTQLEIDGWDESDILRNLRIPDKCYRYVEDRGLFVEADGHDLFRVFNYPKAQLFSSDETLAYLEQLESIDPQNIYYADNPFTHKQNDKDYVLGKLKQFWFNHPNGMIDFG